MRKLLGIVAAIALVVFGVAAAGGSAYAQSDGLTPGVVGVEWQLLEIQRSPQDVVDTSSANITLGFDGQGLATGHSPCNGFSAPYQAGANGSLTFGDVLSTLRACVDNSLMNLESEYYGALKGVSSYSFQGDRLLLTYNSGASILKFGPSVASQSGPAGPPAGTGDEVPLGMPQTGMMDFNYTPLAALGGVMLLVGAVIIRARQARQERDDAA